MSAKYKKPKLTVELIPKTCYFSNIRTTVKSKEWDKIRFISYELANNKCQICGSTGKKQGYKHNVECHEIWFYDDETHVQKLIGLISLCVLCHQVKHIGRAMAIGKQTQCFAHLSKVNKWTKEQIDEHLLESFELNKERSKYDWELDLSILNDEPYNLKINTEKKRIFKVKKYKKKRIKKKTTLNKKPPKKISNKRPPKTK